MQETIPSADLARSASRDAMDLILRILRGVRRGLRTKLAQQLVKLWLTLPSSGLFGPLSLQRQARTLFWTQLRHSVVQVHVWSRCPGHVSGLGSAGASSPGLPGTLLVLFGDRPGAVRVDRVSRPKVLLDIGTHLGLVLAWYRYGTAVVLCRNRARSVLLL